MQGYVVCCDYPSGTMNIRHIDQHEISEDTLQQRCHSQGPAMAAGQFEG